jgi:hypothetical protein
MLHYLSGSLSNFLVVAAENKINPMNRFSSHLLLFLLITFSLTPAASAGPWHSSPGNTEGWQLMVPRERIEHQRHMRGFDDYKACKNYQAGHHERMSERGRRLGVTIRQAPHSGCSQLRRKGKLR